MCVPEWEHPASLWPPPAFSFESGSFEPWPPRFGVRFVSSCRHPEETYQRNVERLEKHDDAGRNKSAINDESVNVAGAPARIARDDS